MSDFPTDPLPDYPLEETSIAPEVLISTHRDGSEQRRLKGSGVERIFKLSFGGSCPITNTQRLEIVNHYTAQNGTLSSFTWTHPERTGETHICRYKDTPVFKLAGYNCYQGDVTLQEVPA